MGNEDHADKGRPFYVSEATKKDSNKQKPSTEPGWLLHWPSPILTDLRLDGLADLHMKVQEDISVQYE